MIKTDLYTLYNGDAVEVVGDLPGDSIHYSIFSPPFAELYTYSDDLRDMSNVRSYSQFFEHFKFLVPELYRILMPGRCLTFHCTDVPAMKERDGYIGLKDFPGDMLRVFQSCGFVYHSKHIIWKDPLIERTRTRAIGLGYNQLCKDSSVCRAGLPDYLITVRKPGDNPEPVAHNEQAGLGVYIGENEPQQRGLKYAHHTWQKYASPVWMDIRQTRTLQSMKAHGDDKHICPLQLDTIERAITLWSNPGDVVLSPFMGIGSEGYSAISLDRRFVGVELKKSYFEQAHKNIEAAHSQQMSLLRDCG